MYAPQRDDRKELDLTEELAGAREALAGARAFRG
jgi:hypothetical protein